MPVQDDIDALVAQITKNVDVENSAKALIDGFATRLQKAIDAATALGATPAQLAPLVAERDVLKTSGDDLAASVAANTEPA